MSNGHPEHMGIRLFEHLRSNLDLARVDLNSIDTAQSPPLNYHSLTMLAMSKPLLFVRHVEEIKR